MTGPALIAGTVPVGPMLSMFDPIFVGINEFGLPHYTRVIYKNLLAAGEPGGGKSGLLNTLAAHAALSAHSRTVLFDAKQVELGMWDDIADEFVGPDMPKALTTLLRLQKVMDNRNAWLAAHRRRKIEPGDGLNVITSIFDEIAVYATVLGTEQEQRLFVSLLRDLVARGRNVAMPVIAATQRPSRGHHPQEPARPVRLPRRVPLHLHRQQRHHPRRRLVLRRNHRHRHRPVQPRRMPAHRRRRRPRAGQGLLPVRRRHHRPGRLRRLDPPHRLPPHRRPGHRRRLNHPPRKGTRHAFTTDPNARQAFITGLRDLADYLAATPPSPSPRTAPRSSCRRQRR